MKSLVILFLISLTVFKVAHSAVPLPKPKSKYVLYDDYYNKHLSTIIYGLEEGRRRILKLIQMGWLDPNFKTATSPTSLAKPMQGFMDYFKDSNNGVNDNYFNNNDYEFFKKWIELGADPSHIHLDISNNEVNSAFYAARNDQGGYKALELLHEFGVDLLRPIYYSERQYKTTPFGTAMAEGGINEVKFFFEHYDTLEDIEIYTGRKLCHGAIAATYNCKEAIKAENEFEFDTVYREICEYVNKNAHKLGSCESEFEYLAPPK